MLRRLYPDQPESFAFTTANQSWAEAQITKYPGGRQASAIIPLLWRAQEQEGWLTRPAIEYVADMLDMAYIRALEVASFYFMFQLQPVGQVAHFQICGTTSCMICGSEDLISVCKEKIAAQPHQISDDGKFSWEEVECLGACSNAPMAQVGKDYYEDLTPARFEAIIDEMAQGGVPLPGPQNGRYTSEPASGLTSLTAHAGGHPEGNASVALAANLKDTIKRIDGTELPLSTPWRNGATGSKAPQNAPSKPKSAPKPQKTQQPVAEKPSSKTAREPRRPEALEAARDGGPDDLKMIKGVGPKLEKLLHSLGFFHFDQVAKWGPEEVAWVDHNLAGFKGRATRDAWVAQAERLARGETTEFSQRAQKDGIYKE